MVGGGVREAFPVETRKGEWEFCRAQGLNQEW